MSDFPYLTLLVTFPMVGAVVLAFVPRTSGALAKRVAMGWSLATLGLTVALWLAFKPNGPRFQLRDSYPWIPQWGVRFTFEVDGIALVMIALEWALAP